VFNSRVAAPRAEQHREIARIDDSIVIEVRGITIRDARNGAKLHRIEGLPAHAFALAFAPDGKRVLSAGRDRVVRVWDTETWDQVVVPPGPGSYIWSMRLSADGETLAMGCGDRTYRIWQAPAGR
jgi:WD40 repeat protein